MVSILHANFAWFVIVSNGLAGVWALLANRFDQMRVPALWWFVAVAQLSIGVQVILGVVAMQTEDLEPTRVHMFYGFIAMATTALIYSYRQQLEAWRFLLYGWGGLFLMGLAIRTLFLTSPI